MATISSLLKPKSTDDIIMDIKSMNTSELSMALLYAVELGVIDLVKTILERYTPTNVQPLDLACRLNDSRIAHLLLQSGMNAERANVALWHAARHENTKMVVMLLEEGVKDLDDEVMLTACKEGLTAIVNIFLEHGTKATKSIFIDNASRLGHAKVVKLLLKYGANPADGIISAAEYGSMDTVLVLMKKIDMQKLYQEDKVNRAFLAAVRNGHIEIAQVLLKLGANVHYSNDEAIRWSAAAGYLPMVKMLIDNGADPRAENDQAFFAAAKYNNKEIMKILGKYVRPKSTNEGYTSVKSGKLRIYKDDHGSYIAIRNGHLYSFMWNGVNYTINNLRHIGKISDKYTIPGKLVSNPHIQMVLQVQRRISENN